MSDSTIHTPGQKPLSVERAEAGDIKRNTLGRAMHEVGADSMPHDLPGHDLVARRMVAAGIMDLNAEARVAAARAQGQAAFFAARDEKEKGNDGTVADPMPGVASPAP